MSELTPIDRIISQRGWLLDAVFTDTGRIIAQTEEVVGRTTSENGQLRRYLSVWDIRERKWVRSVQLSSHPAGKAVGECRKIAYLPLSRSLVGCDESRTLLIVDADTLEIQRKIAVDKWTKIYDFAANESDDALYTVGPVHGRPITLNRFALSSGNLVQQTELPEIEETHIEMRVEQEGGTIAVSVSGSGKSHSYGAVIICKQPDTTSCQTVRGKTGIADLEFLGKDSILFVSSDFADRSHDSQQECVQRLSIATSSIDPHAYCRPGAGVHYALATLGQSFVLGYSGYSSYNWITENTKSIARMISVWDAKSGKLIATARHPGSTSSFHEYSRIASNSAGRKRFLLFNVLGGEMLLYDLESPAGTTH